MCRLGHEQNMKKGKVNVWNIRYRWENVNVWNIMYRRENVNVWNIMYRWENVNIWNIMYRWENVNVCNIMYRWENVNVWNIMYRWEDGKMLCKCKQVEHWFQLPKIRDLSQIIIFYLSCSLEGKRV